jgi:Ras-related C3 botulinum toxin substrate 1
MALPLAIKCVVAGDGAVGKTCMLVSYVSDAFPQDYIPTVFDNYSKTILYQQKPVSLKLWDTAGQEEYDRLRPLSYTKSDAVLVCFAVDSPASFYNARTKWLQEARTYAPLAAIFLVGTKADYRNQYYDGQYDENGYLVEFVQEQEARQLAAQQGCAAYCECSALTQQGLKDMFELVVNTVMEQRRAQRTGCCAIA